jgi:hypothetical protein
MAWSRLKRCLPVGRLGLLLVAATLVTNLFPERQPVEVCLSRTNIYLPVITDWGADYVLLAGNQEKLTEGDTYRFGDDFNRHSIRLMDIDGGEAAFFVKNEDFRAYDQGATHPHKMVWCCVIDINRDDAMFQPQFSGVLIEPDDIGTRWEINQFTAYVYEGSMPGSPVAQTQVLISAKHDAVPYLVTLTLFRYAEENVVTQTFDEELEHRDVRRITDPTGFASQASRFYEGCNPTDWRNCSYIAQFGEYLVDVVMRVPLENWTQEARIPSADWHFLIERVEAKLLGGTTVR